MIYGIISTPDRSASKERGREREIGALVKSFPWPRLSIIAFNGRLFQGFTVCAVRSAATYNNKSVEWKRSLIRRDIESRNRIPVRDCFILSFLSFERFEILCLSLCSIISLLFIKGGINNFIEYFFSLKFQIIRANIDYPKESFFRRISRIIIINNISATKYRSNL